MARVTLIHSDGREDELDVPVGTTLMRAATGAGLDGIVAECGGSAMCATCHVYVDDAWIEKTGKASPMEEDMLDFAFEVRPTSRLSCQIKISPDLDGLVVTTPAKQG